MSPSLGLFDAHFALANSSLMDAAEAAGRAIELGSNFFLFSSARR
jgi:hypothetical protein